MTALDSPIRHLSGSGSVTVTQDGAAWNVHGKPSTPVPLPPGIVFYVTLSPQCGTSGDANTNTNWFYIAIDVSAQILNRVDDDNDTDVCSLTIPAGQPIPISPDHRDHSGVRQAAASGGLGIFMPSGEFKLIHAFEMAASVVNIVTGCV